MTTGVGPMRTTVPLEPLSPTLALAERGDGGPWKQRLCLEFGAGTVRLVTNRARVMAFERA